MDGAGTRADRGQQDLRRLRDDGQHRGGKEHGGIRQGPLVVFAELPHQLRVGICLLPSGGLHPCRAYLQPPITRHVCRRPALSGMGKQLRRPRKRPQGREDIPPRTQGIPPLGSPAHGARSPRIQGQTLRRGPHVLRARHRARPLVSRQLLACCRNIPQLVRIGLGDDLWRDIYEYGVQRRTEHGGEPSAGRGIRLEHLAREERPRAGSHIHKFLGEQLDMVRRDPQGDALPVRRGRI